MSTVYRTVTLELQLDDDQIWEVPTGNVGQPGQRMGVFYLKWQPNSVYVTVSGYVVSSREPLEYGINWMKTIRISEVPTATKNQLISAVHPADLAKS
jgi:hypothetical protein